MSSQGNSSQYEYTEKHLILSYFLLIPLSPSPSPSSTNPQGFPCSLSLFLSLSYKHLHENSKEDQKEKNDEETRAMMINNWRKKARESDRCGSRFFPSNFIYS